MVMVSGQLCEADAILAQPRERQHHERAWSGSQLRANVHVDAQRVRCASFESACVLRARIEMIEAQVAVRAHAASILIESDCCAHCTHSSCSARSLH